MNQYNDTETAEKYFKTLDPKIIKIIHHEVQYDWLLTEEESEVEMLRKKVIEMNVSMHRVRRALFAEHGAIRKRTDEMESRLAILERFICHS